MTRRIISAILAILGMSITLTVNVFVRVDVQLFGLTEEAAIETREFVASLPAIQVVGADSDEDNQRKRVSLDPMLLDANGGEWPFHGPQETGDCSAFSMAGAIEYDQAGQIADGAEIEFQPVNRQWLYSAGRWQNGRKLISGEGSIPSLQVDFVATHGVLFQSMVGAPPYSGQSSIRWGNEPPKIDEFPETRNHLVTGSAKIRNAQEACNAICAGYPIMFGSMRWGTSNNAIKLIDGRNVARDTANWPHAQICCAYDGTVAGQRLFRIMNSWGPNAHKPLSQVPGDRPGGYYVTWETMDSICREGMAFSISGTQGFPKREFNIDWTVIGSAGPTVPETEESIVSEPWITSEGITPDAQVPGTILGSVLIVAAFVLAFFRGNVRSRVATWAAMLILATSVTPASGQDIDFSFLMTKGMTTNSDASEVASVTTGSEFSVDWSVLSEVANGDSVQASAPIDFKALFDAGCTNCSCETCNCVDCQCAATEKLLNRGVEIVNTASQKISDKPTHTGILRPGMRYEWRDGYTRTTPQPGVDYPTVGVYAIREKSVALQPSPSGRWVCNGAGCYWVNN